MRPQVFQQERHTGEGAARVGGGDLAGVLEALVEVGYDGLAAVELSRDSHRGADAAAEALPIVLFCPSLQARFAGAFV